jgi:transposase InsO family protein
MCEVLNVTRSGYYAWRNRPPSQREMANQRLVKQIRAIHQDSYGTYGSPRVFHALLALGMKCSKNRVARLMRRYGIRAKQTRRYKVTTKRNKAHPVAPNLLKRDFTAERPNRKWLADITYIATAEGWLYLATILDLYSRRIVGWSMSERMTSALVENALEMAVDRRQPSAGLIHHSDQGSQYTGHIYQQLLSKYAIQTSMNSVGSYYDNAPMESFFGTLKSELVHHAVYHTRQEARTDLFFYIEAFYNRRRRTRHWAMSVQTPMRKPVTIVNLP